MQIPVQQITETLYELRREVRVHGVSAYPFLLSVCKLINSVFCDCKYVEYWVFDMDFGVNECHTEMGAELKGVDTIEKFVKFLTEKYVF